MSSAEQIAIIAFITGFVGFCICISSFTTENIAGAIAGGSIFASMTYVLKN